MAVLKNMKYGLISRQEEFLLLKKLGVAERNIYSLESFEVLARQLQAGDTVVVKSVRGCFPSMHQFYAFLLRLQELGVEFISNQENTCVIRSEDHFQRQQCSYCTIFPSGN